MKNALSSFIYELLNKLVMFFSVPFEHETSKGPTSVAPPAKTLKKV